MSNSASFTPDRILGLGFGFFAAKAVITAIDFDLFSLLACKPLTATALRAVLQLRAERGSLDFFDGLVSLRLLERIGDGPEALYRPSAEADRYLNRASEHYIGGALIMAGNRLYGFWDHLGEALRSGEAQSEAKQHKRPLFDEIFSNPAKLREFAAAMSGLSRHNFTAFSAKFPFQNYRRHVDCGCSTGLLSKLVAERYPHLQCVAFDLPQVAEIAREHIASWGLAGRIEVAGGSFLSDPLPKGDLITMGQILHDWNLQDKKRIVKAAYDALEPGGAFVVMENLIDDPRRDNTFGFMMSLNMLVEFGEAFDYTFAEFQSWGREAGFKRFELISVHGPCSAAVAHK
jgi:SAM-dependent methyltransferase